MQVAQAQKESKELSKPAVQSAEVEELSEEELAEQEAIKLERLDAMGLSLSTSRREAIQGREATGIEIVWIEDEEHYEGIDDANRGEMNAWRGKPLGQAVPDTDDEDEGSTIFINITRSYVDASSARVADMLLPTDDSSWSIGPTPVPDLIPLSEGEVPRDLQQQINGAAMQQTQHAAKSGQMPQLQGVVQPEQRQQLMQQAAQKSAGAMTEKVIDQAKQKVKEATEKAEKATKRIEDWHVESQYHAEMRSVIEDCSKAGTGVLKGPFPQKKRAVAFVGGNLAIEEKIKPASRRISYWNLFPDPACGENIHNGSFIWEKDDVTAKQLRELKGTPGYIDSQIDECIKEGATQATKELQDQDDPLSGLTPRDKKNLFEIWYYYGKIEKDDINAAGCECHDDSFHVDAQITMVNNRVIMAKQNTLDTGEFPYDVMVWQKRKGIPFGTGVSRHIRTPQRIVNGAGRNMMDNAGIGGGPQLIVQRGVVEPENGVYEFIPRKVWIAAEDADTDHLDNAFRFVTAPMIQAELNAIIQLGMKLAEDVTGLPQLMQGNAGADTPDTVGGMSMLNNNANTVLRRIARLYDDLITEPHIRRYYAYLLQYGENDDEKGDFLIDARGSSALIERDTQNQQILQMAQIVSNPIFGLDPRKWVVELLKSQRFDPERFEYDDEEWQKIVEQMSQPPQDSSVQVATIRAEITKAVAEIKASTDKEIAGLRAKVEAGKTQATLQDKDKERQHESAENVAEREVALLMKSIDVKLDQAAEAGKKNINLDDIKAMLTKTAMELRQQKELSLISDDGPKAATPPTEPAGRADDGKAYEQ